MKDTTAHALLNVRVPMRDGTELATHVYLPAAGGPFPVVLMRTPYNAIAGGTDLLDAPDRGFACVRQDVRGRHLSGGEWIPWFSEKNDGEDTLAWIAAQPWCNGRIVMSGGSYLAATQLAAAMSGHPALKGITPGLFGSEFYHTCYRGGAFRLAWQTCWTLEPRQVSDQDAIRAHLPLRRTDVYCGPAPNAFWRGALDHPRPDGFWQPSSLRENVAAITTPALIRTGWFDLFVSDVFDLFTALRERGGSEAARRGTRLQVGPWPHCTNQRVVGDVDFGEAAVDEGYADAGRAFMEACVNGQPASGNAPVRIFVMGPNVWRDEKEWPPARTVWMEKFLSSGGHANTADGDGTLGGVPHGPEDHYAYDPTDPVPTAGGAWDFTNVGPRDQRAIEQRPDVLVYTSEEFGADTEITGIINVVLFAASDAPDTDFTAKIVDVHPDGRALGVTDGIVRARYRNGDESLLRPGEIHEYSIVCNPTSWVFFHGHRLRLEIASSNFPAFARNLNTGENPADETVPRTARQTVHHDAAHPSRVRLPVLPPRP